MVICMKENLSNDYRITCFVGSPGSGKTSVAQWLVLDCLKRNEKVFSNVSLYGAYMLDFSDLMHYNLNKENEDCTFIIDEAGIEFNNRNWEKLSKDIITFFKLHRHFRVNVYIFSQGEDIDLTFRRLSQFWYKVVKIPFTFGKISALVPVYVSTEIINGKWQIIYEQENNFLFWKYVPIFKTWKYFNSFERPVLKDKQFLKWSVDINNSITLKYKFKIFLKKIYNNVSNLINKILFRKKIRDRILKNIEDSKYFND